MSSVRFTTREIGSLGKPSWRVKAFAGRPLDEDDVREAERWGKKLEVEDYERLLEVLYLGTVGEAERPEIDDWAARYAIRLLEKVGLDVVYDGEQRRTEMYDHVASFAHGFEPRGTVRSFDNKYYAKATVVERPWAEGAQDVEELRFVAAHTERPVKVPLTGAYTMEDWSYDEHYAREGALGGSAKRRFEARRQFVEDVAERVIRPNVVGLIDAGADWIQIDEPAATTKPDEVPLVVLGFNAALRDVGAAKRSMHICFSDYRALWPDVLELEDCLELQLEFAVVFGRLLHRLTLTSRPAPPLRSRATECASNGLVGTTLRRYRRCLRWRRIDDLHETPADQPFARALRHIDPRFRVRVGLNMPMACVRARGAVVLAGLDDSGALLPLRLGRHCARSQSRGTQRQHARHGELQKTIRLVHYRDS